MKPSLFILSFSSLPQDGRVLRQIRALAPHFDLTVAGLDKDPSILLPGIKLRFVTLRRQRSLAGKVLRMLAYLPGAVFPPADAWPWSITSEYRMAREALLAGRFDLVLCNDLNAVLLGVECLRKKGTPFVADYHEFPGGEAPENISYRMFCGPHGQRCLKRYGKLATGSMTVNRHFANVFAEEFGFPAIVVLNAPEIRPLPALSREGDDCLRIVYHGVGGPNRNIELMIEAVGMLKRKAILHLMLLSDAEYKKHLRTVAEKVAPGLVIFEAPVRPADIAAKISAFDVGLFVVRCHSVNNEYALPNKLFEYIHGGLAVCCSMTPAVKEFVSENGNGWIMESVNSAALAAILEAVTPEELAAKKQASLLARTKFHANQESAAMVDLLVKIRPGKQNDPIQR